MIKVRDVEHNTIADAAREFGVSTKTIHEWIRTGKIAPPPTMDWGASTLNVFPIEYLEAAKKQLAEYRRRGKAPVNGKK